jgi:hypothetical protein
MGTLITERPDTPAPAPKHRTSRWAIVGVIVAGLFVLGAYASAVRLDKDTAMNIATAPTEFGPPEPEVTAEMVVDLMPAAKMERFCDAYFALGNYDAALAQFDDGYTSQDLAAKEVFDELLSRC